MSAITIVRQQIGRRRVITREEMAAILLAIPMDLVEASTITGRDSDGALYVGNEEIRNPDQERPATARAWARMCEGITCISVLSTHYFRGELLITGLGVRYDAPGSMHPLQHATLTFVPASVRRQTVAYMRQHADRVLVVRG